MYKVYQQNICPNCLQMLVNNESGHTPSEYLNYIKTLELWQDQNYVPAGPVEGCEPSFSWSKCDLCNCEAGDRYEYNFFDKKSKIAQ